MKGITLANKVSAKCLVSGLGHDFVTVYRGDPHGSSECWMECWECGLNLGELERQEENCAKHTMKCITCGYPMMKDRMKDRIIPDHN